MEFDLQCREPKPGPPASPGRTIAPSPRPAGAATRDQYCVPAAGPEHTWAEAKVAEPLIIAKFGTVDHRTS